MDGSSWIGDEMELILTDKYSDPVSNKVDSKTKTRSVKSKSSNAKSSKKSASKSSTVKK